MHWVAAFAVSSVQKHITGQSAQNETQIGQSQMGHLLHPTLHKGLGSIREEEVERMQEPGAAWVL